MTKDDLIAHLRNMIALHEMTIEAHEETIADMLKTQHPIMRDALRYQTLRESQFDAVVVILTSAGGHMAEPDQIDCEVDRMIEAKSGLKIAA